MPTRKRVMHVPELTNERRAARRQMDPVQRQLWERVRRGQLGFRVRRMDSVGHYIVHFYAACAKLAIDLVPADEVQDPRTDGSLKALFLNSHGVELVKIDRQRVPHDCDGVVADLVAMVAERVQKKSRGC